MLQNAGKSVGPVASNALGTLKRLGGRTGSMVGMIEGGSDFHSALLSFHLLDFKAIRNEA